MICILLSIIATVVGSFATGFIWLFFLMVEPVAIFIYTQIPIAKLATVETFLENENTKETPVTFNYVWSDGNEKYENVSLPSIYSINPDANITIDTIIPATIVKE